MGARVGLNAWEILIILLILLIIFGAGKLPQVMGDLAKGIRSFKAGLKEDEAAPPPTGNEERALRDSLPDVGRRPGNES